MGSKGIFEFSLKVNELLIMQQVLYVLLYLGLSILFLLDTCKNFCKLSLSPFCFILNFVILKSMVAKALLNLIELCFTIMSVKSSFKSFLLLIRIAPNLDLAYILSTFMAIDTSRVLILYLSKISMVTPSSTTTTSYASSVGVHFIYFL